MTDCESTGSTMSHGNIAFQINSAVNNTSREELMREGLRELRIAWTLQHLEFRLDKSALHRLHSSVSAVKLQHQATHSGLSSQLKRQTSTHRHIHCTRLSLSLHQHIDTHPALSKPSPEHEQPNPVVERTHNPASPLEHRHRYYQTWPN